MSGGAQSYPAFPLKVRFQDGDEEPYDSAEDLEMNLEEFDSDDEGCRVTDALGRPVRLKLDPTGIKAFSLRRGR